MITITTQPENCLTQLGKFAEFNIVATSNKEITYQWMKRKQGQANFYAISDVKSFEPNYKFVLNDNYGTEFRCYVRDEDGFVLSNIVSVLQLTNVPARGFEHGFYYEEVYSMNGFTQDMRIYNIQRFVNRLYWWGWSKESIAAVAGNVWLECDTSPGTWQEFDYFDGDLQDSRGYGFVQWTPVHTLTNWCVEFYPDIEWRNNGELQLARLHYEWKHNLEWQQWEAFIHSHASVAELCMIFIQGYLGVQPGSESTWPLRLAQANWIYNNITPCPAPWILKKITERGRKNI